MHAPRLPPEVLSRVTEDTPIPLPGYLVQQIHSVCLCNIDAVFELQFTLFDLLNKPSTSIQQRLNAARLIQILIQSGNEPFHKVLWQRADDISRLCAFVGKSDAVNGDALNAKFREMMNSIQKSLSDPETSVESREFAHRIVGPYTLSRCRRFSPIRSHQERGQPPPRMLKKNLMALLS